ncbi:MAG: hypothetical protein ACI8T1_001526 [Verrucomicrobiales bacterium]|jgi:hypothetical protein
MMKNLRTAALWGALILATLSGCDRRSVQTSYQAPVEEGALFRVGSITVYQADLDHHLKVTHGGRSDEATRERALEQLARTARLAQAAIDEGLDKGPVVRAELARLLSARFKETTLYPKQQEQTRAIPEDRLREVYHAQPARFQSVEKRRAAVLWLEPGKDPVRTQTYVDKLNQARQWFLDGSNSTEFADKGFSVLAIDHSEHAATRFKGGVIGWLEQGGAIGWKQAVSKIVFNIKEIGNISPVITLPEGVFLVGLMDLKPTIRRSFDSVQAELEQEEQRRLRKSLKADFEETVRMKYPLDLLNP